MWATGRIPVGLKWRLWGSEIEHRVSSCQNIGCSHNCCSSRDEKNTLTRFAQRVYRNCDGSD
jgi:hypothetical protein